ncbi:MAG TPA: formylglycine-generating enzyme family protein [Phycisphaerales bacterium]|nr:formylglycine-generating enzyme family protein [Phycisphaerales bacterium]
MSHFMNLDIESGVSMPLVCVPAGGFEMGSPDQEEGHEAEESPLHHVQLTKDIWMGQCPVTQRQWQAVKGRYRDQDDQEADCPAVQVSWNDAQAFAEAMNKLFPSIRFRLPTEAEWEYACRAGTTTRFAGGDTEADLAAAAWYAGNSEGRVHPVGGRRPNTWNLYDMHGNVFEWCSDWEGPYPLKTAIDPLGPDMETKRIMRGGCFKCPPPYYRSANRYSGLPDHRSTNIGFRLVGEVY